MTIEPGTRVIYDPWDNQYPYVYTTECHRGTVLETGLTWVGRPACRVKFDSGGPLVVPESMLIFVL